MTPLPRPLNSLRIRHKLLLGYAALFMCMILLGAAVLYTVVRQTVTERIEAELSTTTSMVLEMVRTAAGVSVKNHLRAVAEKNLEIVAGLHRRSLDGETSEARAKVEATRVLLSQRIGTTGYIYCVNSMGVLEVHPVPSLVGSDLTRYGFIQKQMALKEGYLEYDWKNPGDERTRPKALYMTWFEPWDWIISVSSYRSEFDRLVNVDDFRQAISSLNFGKSGYSFVLDSRGNVVIHPALSGNLIETEDADGRKLIRDICNRKSGRMTYSWRNPGEDRAREKIVYFNYIPELDWIVASSGYLEEFQAPLDNVRDIILASTALSLAVFFGFALWISSTITRPLAGLKGILERAAGGNLSQRAHAGGHDEVGDLSRYFNVFMAKLEASDKMLRGEIAERRQVEAALRESERRYRQLFGSMLGGFALCSIEYDEAGAPSGYTILEVNAAFERISGLTAGRVVGRKVAEIVPAVMAPELLQRFARVDESGGAERFTLQAPATGRVFEVSVFSPEKGLVASFLLDVTDRMRAEEAMRRSRNYVRAIIDSMPSAIVGVDDAGRVTQWNAMASRLTGLPMDEAMGLELTILFPGLGKRLAEVMSSVAQGRPAQVEKVPRHLDGETSYMDIMAYPLRGQGLEGAVIRMDDVTQRVRMEHIMVQTEKMMSVGVLAAGMAHEINNPLGGILQGAQNIARRISPDLPANREAAVASGVDLERMADYMERRRIPRFLEGIQESGRRAAHIVSDMLEFSRRSESRRAPVDMAVLLDKSVELARNDYNMSRQYDFKSITVERDYAPGLPKVPCTDTEIKQVMINLLRNAAQAMSPATAEPVIRVSTRQEDGMVRIEVADNGPGMDEATRKRVFEPFFTTKAVGVGTGLGLSVSYFIITSNHDGVFEVESEPGKGTTFILKLPL